MRPGQIAARKSSLLDVFGLPDDAAVQRVGHLDGVQELGGGVAEAAGTDAQPALLRRQRGVSVRRDDGQGDQQLPADAAAGHARAARVRWTLSLVANRAKTTTNKTGVAEGEKPIFRYRMHKIALERSWREILKRN